MGKITACASYTDVSLKGQCVLNSVLKSFCMERTVLSAPPSTPSCYEKTSHLLSCLLSRHLMSWHLIPCHLLLRKKRSVNQQQFPLCLLGHISRAAHSLLNNFSPHHMLPLLRMNPGEDEFLQNFSRWNKSQFNSNVQYLLWIQTHKLSRRTPEWTCRRMLGLSV